MPKLMEMGLSWPYTEIGIFVGVISGLASFSSIFGGWMADRYSARSIYIVSGRFRYRYCFSSSAMFRYWWHSGLSFMLAFAAAENMLVAHYAVSLAVFGLRCQVRFGFEHRRIDGASGRMAVRPQRRFHGLVYDVRCGGDDRRCCGVHVTRRPPETVRSGGGGLMSLRSGIGYRALTHLRNYRSTARGAAGYGRPYG